MKLIIDKNALSQNQDQLKKFISASRHNYAILTDGLLEESLKDKGTKAAHISRDLSVLSRVPSQVLILKSPISAIKLRGSKKEMARKLIDVDKTKTFSLFYKDITLSNLNDKYSSHFSFMQYSSINTRRYLETKISFLQEDQKKLIDSFTENELLDIRKGLVFTNDIIQKFTNSVYDMAFSLNKQQSTSTETIKLKDLPQTFNFRLAVCQQAYSLVHLQNGTLADVGSERLLHDLYDMFYIVYASYYDGILSQDKKLNGLFKLVNLLIRCANRELSPHKTTCFICPTN